MFDTDGSGAFNLCSCFLRASLVEGSSTVVMGKIFPKLCSRLLTLRSHHIIIFTKGTTAHSPELLHVTTDTKDKAEMYAKRTDVRPGFA